MRIDVFMSYSETDREKAWLITKEIEHNGLRCWFAPADLMAGESLSSIADLIESARHFVVLLSRAATASRWVRKEIDIAVNLELSAERKPLQVVPVLLEKVIPPAILADKVFVDCTGPNWEPGIRELVSILLGKTFQHETGLSRLQSYVKGLIPLPDEVCGMIRNLDSFRRNRMLQDERTTGTGRWRSSGWPRVRILQRRKVIEEALREAGASSTYSSRILEDFDAGRYLTPIFPQDDDDETGSIVREDWMVLLRARASIEEKLREAHPSEDDLALILTAYDEGRVLPVIGISEKEKLSAWLRYADDTILALAVELWRARGDLRVVHADWIVSFVQEQSPSLSEDEAEWRAEQLAARAREAGLLLRSTKETIFEMGPMAFVVGRIATDFELSSPGSSEA